MVSFSLPPLPPGLLWPPAPRLRWSLLLAGIAGLLALVLALALLPYPGAKPFTAGLRRREGCFSCARPSPGCGARALLNRGRELQPVPPCC